MNAAEHFDWAVGRAMEYVEMNQPHHAMASLHSDFAKHADTAEILTDELAMVFVGEIMIDGAQGAKRFIEGIPRPHPAESSFASNAALKDSPDPMHPEGEPGLIEGDTAAEQYDNAAARYDADEANWTPPNAGSQS